MRGLTAVEADVLRISGGSVNIGRPPRPDELAACRALLAVGRMVNVQEGPFEVVAYVTPLGREALRIHDAARLVLEVST